MLSSQVLTNLVDRDKFYLVFELYVSNQLQIADPMNLLILAFLIVPLVENYLIAFASLESSLKRMLFKLFEQSFLA